MYSSNLIIGSTAFPEALGVREARRSAQHGGWIIFERRNLWCVRFPSLWRIVDPNKVQLIDRLTDRVRRALDGWQTFYDPG